MNALASSQLGTRGRGALQRRLPTTNVTTSSTGSATTSSTGSISTSFAPPTSSAKVSADGDGVAAASEEAHEEDQADADVDAAPQVLSVVAAPEEAQEDGAEPQVDDVDAAPQEAQADVAELQVDDVGAAPQEDQAVVSAPVHRASCSSCSSPRGSGSSHGCHLHAMADDPW